MRVWHYLTYYQEGVQGCSKHDPKVGVKVCVVLVPKVSIVIVCQVSRSNRLPVGLTLET